MKASKLSVVAVELVIAAVVLQWAWHHPTGRYVIIGLAVLTVLVVSIAQPTRQPTSRRTPRWTGGRQLDQLRALTPAQFEHVVADMMTEAGFTNVRVVGGAGDLQADVVGVSPAGRSTIVQVKRLAAGNKVTSGMMQSFAGMQHRYHQADLGMYVTTSCFTAPAARLARKLGVVTIDGAAVSNGITSLVRRANL